MIHQTLLDLLERRYRCWRLQHSRANGRPKHGRHVHWWATKLPRIASRFFPDIIWRGLDPGPDSEMVSRHLALTFDDGPSPDQTPLILDELARHNCRATFFVLGAQAEKHPDLIREIVRGGHRLGNHTWSHIDAWLHDFPVVAHELARTDELLEHLTGCRPEWVRPPHGHFTAKLRAWCADRGQRVVLWDTMPGDFVDWATPAGMTDFVLRQVRPGSIIVLHDGPEMPWAAQTLPLLLPCLVDQGWNFPQPIPRDTFGASESLSAA